MSSSLVIQGILRLRRHKHMQTQDVEPGRNLSTPARIPRIARLMALARRVEELVRSGTVESYAVAARLGRVSRARMSQILYCAC